ncbi:ATP-binding protein [Methanosphaera sp. ISO3-F5]|uniref:AAA family ATPase n=1 Tax=Methanosphaera sp. ISO3-F5 TaxID=1452353 RepID=UPI002B25C738|nr:ATP-binding protein [Methanosphaera sp. ISO3-F5]WQH63936.1 ATP-binding protein [Methanosphaera sp. ISO3-F5]
MKYMPIVMPEDIDKYFYNRTNEIELLNANLSLLEKGIPNQYLLTGYRGIGKTSLLKKILKHQPKKYLTTYIDLSAIYGQQKGKITEEELIKEILHQIEETLEENSTTLNKIKEKLIKNLNQLKLKNYTFNNTSLHDIPIPTITENYSKLSKFVMELPQKIVDTIDEIKGYIIVIDEFQLLKTLENPEAFFWLIRSYTQKQFNVSYIFTGSVSNTAEIITMINGQTGAFGGRMLQININPFTKEQTKNYIDEKSNNIKFTPEGFERFYKCTRGIPAYINSFCNILPNNITCTPEIIKESMILNIDNIAIMWLRVWGTLNRTEKELITLFVEYGSMNNKTIQDKVDYTKITLNKYLEILSNKGIIDYSADKKYYLADEMLKTWLKIKKDTQGRYPQ